MFFKGIILTLGIVTFVVNVAFEAFVLKQEVSVSSSHFPIGNNLKTSKK
jgi:hypothetical protein